MGEIRESGTCMHMVTFDRALSANEKLNQETSAAKLQNIYPNVTPNERLNASMLFDMTIYLNKKDRNPYARLRIRI